MGLYAKLASVMTSIGTLKKAGENTYFRYKFTTADDAYSAVRDALAEQNIAFVASMVNVQQHETGQVDKGGSPVVRTIATFEYTFIDPETGESKICQWVGEATDSQDKGVSKASTSALKYFLLKTFMISTEADDPDKGKGYSGKNQEEPKQAQRRPQAQPERKTEPPAKPKGTSEPTNGTTRATLSPDKLVNTLKTKAANIEVEVQKADNGTIMYISTKDAQALARDMESIMLTKTRKWILSQAFDTETCTELNHRQAAAVSAWLKDKAAARLDAEGVKAFLERTNAPDDAAAEFANI